MPPPLEEGKAAIPPHKTAGAPVCNPKTGRAPAGHHKACGAPIFHPETGGTPAGHHKAGVPAAVLLQIPAIVPLPLPIGSSADPPPHGRQSADLLRENTPKELFLSSFRARLQPLFLYFVRAFSCSGSGGCSGAEPIRSLPSSHWITKRVM